MTTRKNIVRSGLHGSPKEREGLPTLVFDGACEFCTWTVDFLRNRLREPVVLVPWQRMELDALGLSERETKEAAWWVEVDGAKRKGHEAVARALRACHLPWRVLGTIAEWPVLRGVSARFCAFVSRNRSHFPGTTAALDRQRDGTSTLFKALDR